MRYNGETTRLSKRGLHVNILFSNQWPLGAPYSTASYHPLTHRRRCQPCTQGSEVPCSGTPRHSARGSRGSNQQPSGYQPTCSTSRAHMPPLSRRCRAPSQPQPGLTWWTKTSRGGSTRLPSLAVMEINPKPIRTLNHLQKPAPDTLCGPPRSPRSGDLSGSSPTPLPAPPARSQRKRRMSEVRVCVRVSE